MKLLKPVAIAIAAIAILLYLLPGRLEHSISFLNKEFKHAESFDREGMTSYFYTPTGGNPGEADEFIQLVVFDEGVSEDRRSAILRQSLGSFNLEPFGDGGSTYLGVIDDDGGETHVYASDARSPSLDSIAFYVTAEDMTESEAAQRAQGYFTGLASIQSQLE